MRIINVLGVPASGDTLPALIATFRDDEWTPLIAIFYTWKQLTDFMTEHQLTGGIYEQVCETLRTKMIFVPRHGRVPPHKMVDGDFASYLSRICEIASDHARKCPTVINFTDYFPDTSKETLDHPA